jgi:signal transduction histidine kinase
MRSLGSRLTALWLLALAACVAVAILLAQLSAQSLAAQVGRAEADVAHACDLIAARFGFYVAGWSGPSPASDEARLRADLAAAVGLALAHQDGIEGGVWQAEAGPLAYAYPTYRGSGPKTDLPAAERGRIAEVNGRAERDEQAAALRADAGGETLLLHACPLPGPIAGLTAWTMTRVRAAPGYGPLQAGLGVLLLLMLAMSAWLGWTLLVWRRHVRGIERALAEAGPDGLPRVARTRERELDRIIEALNEAGERLAQARQAQAALAARVAAAERLAALGRVAAGVAHEIRNPLAAARLQGENALAGDDARRRDAIAEMLDQIARLERLVTELLAMTQRAAPVPQDADLATFLPAQAERHAAAAAARGVRITVAGAAGRARLDPALIARVLDNLLGNAVRHAAPGGQVVLAAAGKAGGALELTVEDDGAGVAPDLAGTLFEPFVTGRADGTGLGLAIARELAEAHGGTLTLRRAGGTSEGEGAAFALVLPGAMETGGCQKS